MAWCGCSMDSHDAKRHEEALNFHASLLDYACEAMIATDAELNITAWNWVIEAIYSWSAAEVLGRKVSAVTGSTMTTEARAAALQQMAAQRRFQVETFAPTVMARPFWSRRTVLPCAIT